MSPGKIRELEEMFYEECTNRKAEGQYMLVNKVPKEVFQWIVDNVIKAKEEVKLKPVKKNIVIEEDPCNHNWKDCDYYYICMHCGRRRD